ncbi:PRP38 family protein [Sporobolomyces salmoneus]|uniref:PRP38 family protein n=1 Tax=Sporobolomyces salmoneus TaxID=183962 RepID=UPI003172072F
MANTTRAGALSIHGTNPQYLVPTVIRQRVYDTLYWKEHCFALDAASVIDKAVELNHVGGTYANTRPTEFMCLVLKLLQLQPEREIVLEYLRAEEFKYLRALAAFYVRLTFDSLNAYEVLEPLLDDYRKLRFRGMDGSYRITTIDQFADELLSEEMVCEIQLPRLTQRKVLEETEGLATRRSKLGKAMGVAVVDKPDQSDSEEEDEEGRGRYLSRSPTGSRSSSYDSVAEARRSRSRSGSRERYVSRSPSPTGGSDAEEGGRYMSRSPSASPEAQMQIEVERVEGDV